MFVVSLYIILSDSFIGNSMSIHQSSASDTVSLNNIEYTFYDYQVTWEEARMFCLGFDSELAVLDTEEKEAFISGQIAASNFGHEEFWIGSKINFQNHWVWTETNAKVTFGHIIPEMIETLNYSNVHDIYCLTVFRRDHNIPMFIPTRCLHIRRFICQKNKIKQEEDIINAFSTRVEKNHFLLFLSKLTWFEAVAQCRIRGFQIAEILSPSEARILGIKMLKLRPRSIESAWIGGHFEDRIWKWLPSGNNIIQNELWQDKNMVSGSCLLLDRHGLKLPTYLSSKCDRKRDFLCQIPTKNKNADPVLVIADSCEYWINFRQLNWYKANETCNALNATLVSFKSPITVKHVTDILRDNRKELRHIWIGGRLTATNDDFNPTGWQWEDSADKILEDSNISWCDDAPFCESIGDCLNMDLEDYYAPMVYGLDCNNEQAFICQQRSENCSFMTVPSSKSLESKDFKSKEEYSENSTTYLNGNTETSTLSSVSLGTQNTTEDTRSTSISIMESTESGFLSESITIKPYGTQVSVPIVEEVSAQSYLGDTTISSESTTDLDKEFLLNNSLSYTSDKVLLNDTMTDESESSELLSFDDVTSYFNDTALFITESPAEGLLNSTTTHKADSTETSEFFSEVVNTPNKLEDDDFEISVRKFNLDLSSEVTTIKSLNERFQEILKLMDHELELDSNKKKIKESLSKIVETSLAENMKNIGLASDSRLKESNAPASNLQEDEYEHSFPNRFFAGDSMSLPRERSKGLSSENLENKKTTKEARNQVMEYRSSSTSRPIQLRENSYSTKDAIQSIQDSKKGPSANFSDLMSVLRKKFNEKNFGQILTAARSFSSGVENNIIHPWNALFTRILHDVNGTRSDKKLIGFNVTEIQFD